MTFRFELLHKSRKSKARRGRLHTPHGIVETPGFVAVGTNGTLKAVDSHTAERLGLQLMFANTYHLLLQPGPDVIEKAGGLHRFSSRKQPIITDSGGFQVFSLAYGSVASELKSSGQKKQDGAVVKITEDGVLFRSYRDGRKIWLTPESSIAIQKKLGADIIIPLDELPPYHISREKLIDSLERTHRWELRSLAAHLAHPNNQAMFAVIHGGVDPELRKKSVQVLSQHPFAGFAIGGSLGKTKSELFELLSYLPDLLEPTYPRHLLGIGDLESIEESVRAGIDTLDSSYPTRSARHGVLLTKKGPLHIQKREYQSDFGPIEEECPCPACERFSRAYINHLFKAKELVALQLASFHNLAFMMRKMACLREEIEQDLI